MITEQDLQEAIAECMGERHPNANTCIKLAAFYTIKANLYPDQAEPPMYSFAPAPADEPVEKVMYEGDTDFASAIQGRDAEEVWALMDELMSTVSVLHPRLYDSVMRRLK